MDTELVKIDRQKDNRRVKQKSTGKPVLPGARIRARLSDEDREILKAVFEARDEWIEAGNNFEYAHEDMLIDYYIYKLKACESRYAYFVKLAKERGLSHYI
ncbi:MAG: YaaL family protein [Bacillota bacterium]